ncbi:MAG: nicotinate-nucleotide adenylyltransferase, partial [Candidatus Aminicenantes bacterium]|nr:nicotinate-nucleotide adenylyltransferase [Candidatus Aminicenantes bacterium]
MSFKKKKKIGLFGGTFNPVHLGHLKAAEVVQRKFLLDKILFIPSYIPPHKESSEVASPLDRLSMVELAVAPYPRFIPSSIEIEAKERSYSIITLGKIKKIFPDAWIFFILGIDAFLEIDTWKDYKKVLQQCCFIVISRSGFRLLDAKEVIRGKYGGRICDVSGIKIGRDYKFLPGKIFLFPINALNVASTGIRKRIREGASWEEMVSKRVEYYIKENRL